MAKYAQFLQVSDLGNTEEVIEDEVGHVHLPNDGLGVQNKLEDKAVEDYLEA